MIETVVRDMREHDHTFEFLFVKGYHCLDCNREWPC